MSRLIPAVDWVERKLREVRRRLDRAEAELVALQRRPIGPIILVPAEPGEVAFFRFLGCNSAGVEGIEVEVVNASTLAVVAELTSDADGYCWFVSDPDVVQYNYTTSNVPTGYNAPSGSYTKVQIEDPAQNPKVVNLAVTAGYICTTWCDRPIRLNGTVTDQFGTTSLTWPGAGSFVCQGSRTAVGNLCNAGTPGSYNVSYQFSSAGLRVSITVCSGTQEPASAGSGGIGFSTLEVTETPDATDCGPPASLDFDYAGTLADGTSTGSNLADRVYQSGATTATFDEVP